MRALSLDLVDDEASRLAMPADWIARVLDGLETDLRAGRDLPLSDSDPSVEITISEGAVRELVRAAGDGVQSGADGTLAVLVAIAVESSAQAPATARAVAASLRRMLGESASITVRIRRVTPPAEVALPAEPVLAQVESPEGDVAFSG